MPKVTKKTQKEEQALRPVPTAMDTDADDGPSTSGAKIKFAPMSVFDQNGKKIEFRRVSLLYLRFLLCRMVYLSLKTEPQNDLVGIQNLINLRNAADHSAAAENDAPENGLAVVVPAHHRAAASGHADEPQKQKGMCYFNP